MEKFDDAQRLYSQSLEIQEKSLGTTHPSVAVSCRNLAHLYWRRNQFDEAMRYYQRCLVADQKNCRHQDELIIGDDQFYIATVYEKLKDLTGGRGPDSAESVLASRAVVAEGYGSPR